MKMKIMFKKLFNIISINLIFNSDFNKYIFLNILVLLFTN